MYLWICLKVRVYVRVCVCHNAVGTKGPHVLVQRRLKLNWKLLIWPSLAIRFGLEQNIYSLHMLCFPLHSLLLFSSLSGFISPPYLPPALPFFSIYRYRFRCGEQNFTSQHFKWSILFPPPCCSDYPFSMWMNPAVFLPESWLTWYLQLSISTFRPASVESHRCGYNDSTPCWKQLCCRSTK